MDAPRQIVLSQRSESAVDLAIARAGLAAERAISMGRIVFYLGILARFFVVAELSPGRVLLTTVPLGLSIAFSLVVLLAVRRPPRGEALALTSVLLDAGTAFLVLLANALWPAPDHPGILYMPDTVGILVATVGAGFRLSWKGALAGGLANAAGLTGLVLVDSMVWGPRFTISPGTTSIYALFLVAFALLAAILARVTRALARQGAVAATRAEHAERGLGSVLADSHDLSSLISSACIHAELLDERAPSEDSSHRYKTHQLLQTLREIRQMVLGVRSRAMSDLISMNHPVEVKVKRAVNRVVDHVKVRFPGVQLDTGSIPSDLRAVVAGGESTLHRMLLNLLFNACEAVDEDAQASQVTVEARPRPETNQVQIAVADDGPGFPDEVIRRDAATTKPDGTGVGLTVVRGLVEASGGQFRFGNRPEGGAEVVLTLPGAA